MFLIGKSSDFGLLPLFPGSGFGKYFFSFCLGGFFWSLSWFLFSCFGFSCYFLILFLSFCPVIYLLFLYFSHRSTNGIVRLIFVLLFSCFISFLFDPFIIYYFCFIDNTNFLFTQFIYRSSYLSHLSLLCSNIAYYIYYLYLSFIITFPLFSHCRLAQSAIYPSYHKDFLNCKECPVIHLHIYICLSTNFLLLFLSFFL